MFEDFDIYDRDDIEPVQDADPAWDALMAQIVASQIAAGVR